MGLVEGQERELSVAVTAFRDRASRRAATSPSPVICRTDGPLATARGPGNFGFPVEVCVGTDIQAGSSFVKGRREACLLSRECMFAVLFCPILRGFRQNSRDMKIAVP